jgi:hypothetical protein
MEGALQKLLQFGLSTFHMAIPLVELSNERYNMKKGFG